MSLKMCFNGDVFAPLPLRKAYLKTFALKEPNSTEGEEKTAPGESKTIAKSTSTKTCTSSRQHSLKRFKLHPRLVNEAREYIEALDEKELKRRHVSPSKTNYDFPCGAGQKVEGKGAGELEEEVNISLLLDSCGISFHGKSNQLGIFEGCTVTLNSFSLFSCDSCPRQTKSSPSVCLKGLQSLISERYEKLFHSDSLPNVEGSEIVQAEALLRFLERELATSVVNAEITKTCWSHFNEYSNCWWHQSFRQASFLRHLFCPLIIDCQKCGTTSQLVASISNDRFGALSGSNSKNTGNGNFHGVSLLHALLGVPGFAPVVLSYLEKIFCQSSHTSLRCQSPVSVYHASASSVQGRDLELHTLVTTQFQSFRYLKISSEALTVLDRIISNLPLSEKIAETERFDSPSRTLPLVSQGTDSLSPRDCQTLYLPSNSGESAKKRNSLLRKGMKRILESVLINESAASRSNKRAKVQTDQTLAKVAVKAPEVQTSTAALQEYLQHRRHMLKQVQQLQQAAATRLESLKQMEDTGVLVESPMRSSARQTKAISQERATSNAEVFLDSSDISREDFIASTIYLHDVHKLFEKRSVVEGKEPRMPLKHIQVPESVQKRLHDILFDADGSLRSGILNDIDVSTENDPRFINFGNDSKTGRKDLRFQVGFRKQVLAGGAPIPTRETINDLFVEIGVIDPAHESLHEIGILIGGTEDQSLHHDCARRFVKWYPHPLTGKETEKELAEIEGVLDGFEVDVLRYNTVMSSPYAPASLVVALDNKGEMLLGVQKDKILRQSLDSKWCVIVGADNAKYEIVRETNTLVVLRVVGGVIFAGDFPHCGVRNVCRGTAEEMLLNQLNRRIQTILNNFSARQRISRSKAVVDMLCQFPGLDKLCRLHCSTQTHDCGISIPFNMIGYASCLMNERDDRCLEKESNDCGP